jgi:hypothetical protein
MLCMILFYYFVIFNLILLWVIQLLNVEFVMFNFANIVTNALIVILCVIALNA